MTTTNNPAVGRDQTSNVRGNSDLARVNRPARGGETKAFYKTTEFIVYIIATVGVFLASFLVQTNDAHEDYFRADQAWLYIVILSVGYMVSRGLAKSGSRHRDNDA